MINDGYAAPIRNRPVKLVLAGGTTIGVATFPADLHTWMPGRTVTTAVTFTARRTSGAYPLSLSLPDPSARLAPNPAYAIQLAGTGLWDAARGRNSLRATLTVR